MPEDLLDTLNVSRETKDRLEHFEALVHKWNPAINLVSKVGLNDFWNRHIMDSLQILVKTNFVGTLADLGSGGGFPAIPVAIALKEQAPDTHYRLVESDKRKCAFLSTAIRELNLNASVIPLRIEQVAPLQADILTARALSDVANLLEFSERHLVTKGQMVLLKGQTWNEEIDAARKGWDFDFSDFQSLTNSNARILVMQNIQRRQVE